MLSLARLKDIAAVVQTFLLTVAIPIGGYWTWRVHSATRQKELAELALAKAQAEERERNLRADLNPKILGSIESKSVLQVEVVLTNTGAGAMDIDWKDVVFDVTRIDDVLPDGTYKASRPSRSLLFQLIETVLDGSGHRTTKPVPLAVGRSRLKAKLSETFTANQTLADGPGIYLVRFMLRGQDPRAGMVMQMAFVPVP
jgi:hypothetical protein